MLHTLSAWICVLPFLPAAVLLASHIRGICTGLMKLLLLLKLLLVLAITLHRLLCYLECSLLHLLSQIEGQIRSYTCQKTDRNCNENNKDLLTPG